MAKGGSDPNSAPSHSGRTIRGPNEQVRHLGFFRPMPTMIRDSPARLLPDRLERE
jgi:hypothetical protein